MLINIKTPCWYFNIYEHVKFNAQPNSAIKETFITSKPDLFLDVLNPYKPSVLRLFLRHRQRGV